MQPGANLLHYRLVESIGEGGMGVVWKARDTTLDREVAVKVLPADFAADGDRLARFHREAKVLASLNHPNVAAIFGLHETAGDDGAPVRFLAMELVEGRNLQQALEQGPLPLDRALDVARQMATGIAAAHDRGVIHRDLKPANVACTPAGEIKILDFGLAKAEEADADGFRVTSGSSAPTATSAGSTVAGAILGTAPYMSPEQARGRATDKRTDVWAFGCVVYELLSGKPAFGGETVTDVLAAVLRAEPDWTAIEGVAPPRLIRLLQRCLQKDAKKRLRDVGDAGLLLDEIAAGDDGREAAMDPTATTAQPVAAHGPWKILALLFGAAALLLAGLWLTKGGGAAGHDAGPTVSAMTLLTDLPESQSMPSLSPDGKQLLFVAEDGGDADIFLQRVGGENPRSLTAGFDDHDAQPAWSPDGESIAFLSTRDGGGLFVMGATGESPRRVSDSGFAPSWSPDGTRLVYCDEFISEIKSRLVTSKLTVVEIASGDRLELPTGHDAVEGQWSPDGRFITYWTAEDGQRDILVIASDGKGEPVWITNDLATDWRPVWGPGGRSIYFVSDRGGSPDLWRVPVDPATGERTGPLQAVTTGVAGVHSISASADGSRIAVGILEQTDSIRRVAFDPDAERLVGEPEVVIESSNGLMQTSLSPDGQWLAYRSRVPQDDLFLSRVDGSDRRRLTDDAARDRGPSWGPNGDWLFFYSNREGTYDHWIVHRDGTGMRRVTHHPQSFNSPAWSHDGTRVQGTLDQGTAIYDVDPAWLDASAAIEPIDVSVTVEEFAGFVWSPDDRHIVGLGKVDGVWGWAFYDVESRELRRMPGLSCDGASSGLSGDWLDERRFLCWNGDLRTGVVFDIETGEVREVPDLPGSGGVEVTDEGRTLYLTLPERDEEIWLLSLDGGAGE